MKKKLFLMILTILSVCNVKALENDIFKIEIPENFIEEKVEDKSNIYKWENEDNDIFHNIVITIDDNNNEDKFNVKNFTDKDITSYTKYIEDNINNELSEYNIKVNTSNMKKETINNYDVLSYNTTWPTQESLGYDTYQKGYVYTTNKYIITLTYTSNNEIKDNDEALTKIINSFQINDEAIEEESFLYTKGARIIITALLLGVIGAIISLIIPKKHK